MSCQDLKGEGPAAAVKRFNVGEVSGLSVIIRKFMKILQSRTKVEKVLIIFMRKINRVLESKGKTVDWEGTVSDASRKILLAYQPEAEQLVRDKKIRKDLVVQAKGGVLYCADRGFRSRIGVPIIEWEIRARNANLK